MSNHNDSDAQIDLLLQQRGAVPDSQPLAERIIAVSSQAEQYVDSPLPTYQSKSLFSKLRSGFGMNFGLERFASPLTLATAVVLLVVVFSTNILTPPNTSPIDNSPTDISPSRAQQISQNTPEINDMIVNSTDQESGIPTLLASEDVAAVEMELAQLDTQIDTDEFSWDALLLLQDEMSFAQL